MRKRAKMKPQKFSTDFVSSNEITKAYLAINDYIGALRIWSRSKSLTVNICIS